MCDLGMTVKLAQLSSLARFPPHLPAALVFKTLCSPARQGHFGLFRKGEGTGTICHLRQPALVPAVKPGGRRASRDQEIRKTKP